MVEQMIVVTGAMVPGGFTQERPATFFLIVVGGSVFFVTIMWSFGTLAFVGFQRLNGSAMWWTKLEPAGLRANGAVQVSPELIFTRQHCADRSLRSCFRVPYFEVRYTALLYRVEATLVLRAVVSVRICSIAYIAASS